jgi:ABC-type lipoprotein export system ATPase subunit
MVVLDEPTGNLDYDSGQKLLNILARLHKEGKCIVMVTHDLEYISFAKTVIRMFDGTVSRIYQEAEKTELMQEVASHIISA